MAVQDGKPFGRPLSVAGESPPVSDETPISTSGVVMRAPAEANRPKPRRRDSEPPSFRHLTPYQARLDVEMDDTAVSKVRDPSVSMTLDEKLRPGIPWLSKLLVRRDAVASTVLGAAFGVLLVALVAVMVRACG